MPMRRRPRSLDKEVSDVQFERVMGNAAKLATVVMGGTVFLIVLQQGQFILAPIFLAIIIGLMFGPVADFLERRGVPPAISGLVVMVLLLAMIAAFVMLFAGPIAEWVERGPAIWAEAREQLLALQDPLAALSALNEQVSSIFSSSSTAVSVVVEDSSAVTDIALFAPSVFAQIGIFLAALYFFIATRKSLRVSILSLCISRKLRWRAAHIFQDVETKVSTYLLTITAINIVEGIVVTLVMWWLGMPTPLLWGVLAALLNYIPFVGSLLMVLMLLAVGLGTRTGIEQVVLPAALYWAINLVEAQFITPQVVGRTLTMNPFVIFIGITFWIWSWGVIGGLIAIPTMLIFFSILKHILPSRLTQTRVKREVAQVKAEMKEEDRQEDAAAVAAAVDALAVRPA